jgi:anthranilate phosphoribosyltransferase
MECAESITNNKEENERMDIKHLLKEHAYLNIPLSFDEARALGAYALKGCRGDQLAQIQSIAVLCALHTHATYAWTWSKYDERRHGHPLPRSAAEQIAGVCAAVFEEDIAVSTFGFVSPNVPYAMDNCGMGGDLVVTANVSTIAALIAAAAGIPMCKHGSPANADAGRHGSSDFIELLGINPYASKDEVVACVEEESFGYIEALDVRYKHIHAQTHRVAQLPHMNDIIGPITSPLHPEKATRKILGINHLIPPRVVADAYLILNKRCVTALRHGLFVRGFLDDGSGIDEVSICAEGTQIIELLNGKVTEYHLSAEHFGVSSVPADAVSPPQGMSKGEFSLRILRGEISGPPLQTVLANAALLFWLVGRSSDLRECYRLAEDVQRGGGALAKAEALRARIPLEVPLARTGSGH